MALKDRYDFDMLVNEAEGLVLTELEAQMARTPGLCTCQDCVLDMAAYALNNVRPSYRASLMGSLYAKAAVRPTYTREITQAVHEAIEKVRANPSHD
jgi:competence protein ComFB